MAASERGSGQSRVSDHGTIFKNTHRACGHPWKRGRRGPGASTQHGNSVRASWVQTLGLQLQLTPFQEPVTATLLCHPALQDQIILSFLRKLPQHLAFAAGVPRDWDLCAEGTSQCRRGPAAGFLTPRANHTQSWDFHHRFLSP